jgi:hypothetical protein
MFARNYASGAWAIYLTKSTRQKLLDKNFFSQTWITSCDAKACSVWGRYQFNPLKQLPRIPPIQDTILTGVRCVINCYLSNLLAGVEQ